MLSVPAAERNRQPILEVLQQVLPNDKSLFALEIASGSGQHLVHFAPHFPHVTWQPSDIEQSYLKSINAYQKHSNLVNILQPVRIDVSKSPVEWAVRIEPNTIDVILNINMIHITPWYCTEGLFIAAGFLLCPQGILVTYGPYAVKGHLEPESNVRFDLNLKRENPEYGVRDTVDLERLGALHGITLEKAKGKRKRKSSFASSLKKTDPEFHSFLKDNDKELLDFEDFSATDSDDEDQNEGPPSYKKSKVNQKNLDKEDDDEDESDSENEADDVDVEDDDAEEEGLGGGTITAQLVQTWAQELQSQIRFLVGFRNLVMGLQAVERTIGSGQAKGPKEDQDKDEDEDGDAPIKAKYTIKSAAAFNAVLRLCVRELIPHLSTHLKFPPGKTIKVSMIAKAKGWNRVCPLIRTYAKTYLKLLSSGVTADMLKVFLKHCHELVPYISATGRRLLVRRYLRTLVRIWSRSEETNRVLAFVAIFRLTHGFRPTQPDILDFVLKQMYMSYVGNSKFTSPSSWPGINFMRHSLNELYALDPRLAYRHGFVFIRQLAIHLRAALINPKKETLTAVTNWQYMHCLYLWGELIGKLHHDESVKTLVHPFVQVLTIVDFNKKTDKKAGGGVMVPINWHCVLHLSPSQMKTRAFRDGLLDQMHLHLAHWLAIHSTDPAFPEIAFPVSHQMRLFLKACRVSTYGKKLKGLLNASEESSGLVKEDRAKVKVGEGETRSWQESPLGKYYRQWKAASSHSSRVL
ncbi:unnamed protein product [Darwinula stevensoni]|uniref:Nucleolar complex protein 2 homolog n=1 Tax=Darwinula stevensoni TaxID=69355 RepID=A0A7R9ABJ5_9CRUS|nr:unnamed protein product [Darwinula stevensoni]CAG0899443.1 unnamed protein product [Darwinula stevensoni]